jgi:hypothetical protein
MSHSLSTELDRLARRYGDSGDRDGGEMAASAGSGATRNSTDRASGRGRPVSGFRMSDNAFDVLLIKKSQAFPSQVGCG